MNRAELNKIISDTFATIQHLSDAKGGEYSGDKDALSNFKRNGEAVGVDSLVIWSVYFAKHHDSLMTYIKDIATGNNRQLTEPIDGRIDDMITYLLLCKGLIKDREIDWKRDFVQS